MNKDEDPLPSYDLSKLVILVAEKHPAMRSIMKEVLRKFGMRNIYVESTPEAAFQTFCSVNPDIVTIDWGPEFDGVSLLNKIRQDQASPNQVVPVIMITAYTEKSRVYVARDAGITEFLAQPVSAKAVYEHICKIIETPREFIRTKTYTGPDRRRHKGKYDGEERRKGGQTSDEKPRQQKPKEETEGDEPSP
ncbi:MAG: response regulator [Alphaproteobacteria bacterium]|nr:response regulator [Alphaproteobacteria bacterium]